MGQTWIHIALAVAARFVIDIRVGPRTLDLAAQLVASVALACPGAPGFEPSLLLLIDDHRPYPAAPGAPGLVLGMIQHHRRPSKRGRKRHPTLKARPALLVGVVHKIRDQTGNLLGVKRRALFGTLQQVRRRILQLGIGRWINPGAPGHVERLNGTIRGQVAWLTRRSRCTLHVEIVLQWAAWLWRDLYHWTRVHGSLHGRTPAMAIGLTGHIWTVKEYVSYPVHISDLQSETWAARRKAALESALDTRKRKKTLPIS